MDLFLPNTESTPAYSFMSKYGLPSVRKEIEVCLSTKQGAVRVCQIRTNDIKVGWASPELGPAPMNLSGAKPQSRLSLSCGVGTGRDAGHLHLLYPGYNGAQRGGREQQVRDHSEEAAVLPFGL